MSMITTSFKNRRQINVFGQNFAPNRFASIHFAMVFLFLLLLSVPAYAQERDDWPRTFTGQPDFVFLKKEVLELNKERAENGEDVRNTLKPWAHVLNAVDIHPFRPAREQTEEGDTDIQEPAPALILNEEPALATVELPDAEEEQGFSTERLREKLGVIITREAAKAPIVRGEINPMAVLEKLRLQSIVMSPAHYVQMNGRKLKEGESFYVPLSLSRSYIPVEKAVQQAVPHLEDEKQQAEAQMVAAAVLKAHKLARATAPNLYQVRHDVAVEIVKIESRSVTVKLLDKTYPIGINYVF